MECLFCNIIYGKTKAFKVWEDSDLLLLLDIKPINPGHVILITKKHADSIFDLREPLYTKTFRTAKRIARKLQRVTKAKRIGLAIEGFGVPHIHLHLVPVNKGNELNPLRAKSISKRKLQAMQRKLMARLK